MVITVGGKNFKTKKTLINYCKYVLNNADLNSELLGEWGKVIGDVFKMHESFKSKTKGLEYTISVRPCFINPRNRQFFIKRSDGTDTEFSYYQAISPKSKASYVKETLRASIREQVEDYKEKYFLDNKDSRGYVLCPETELKIKKTNSHIDHYPKQFDEIISEWSKIVDVSSKDIVLVEPPNDNATYWEMEDQDLLKSFQDFHKEVASYRIVLDKVNLQRKRGKKSGF